MKASAIIFAIAMVPKAVKAAAPIVESGPATVPMKMVQDSISPSGMSSWIMLYLLLNLFNR